MDSKKSSNKATPPNSASTKPELKNTSNEEEAKKKAEQEVIKARDKRILMFASSHNTLSKNTGSVEVKLEELFSASNDIKTALEEKTELLKSSGKFKISGKRNILSGFQKTKVRNEIRNLKKSQQIIKKNISQLERSLTNSFKNDTNRIVRSNVRISAKRTSYHNRYGGNVKAAITKLVNGLSDEELKTLKANVAKSGSKKGDAVMLQALIKAPRNLLTKVAANPDARTIYMQHFRNELKVGK
ncbi:MAG: hypothetical protein HND52_12675 [Ignavibacteriae bacterium]|nr:hypothetical protein [Ignavibacteriota bacterium]NOG98805.1 hypothetical protein [Ignavibacteriota bacterium]